MVLGLVIGELAYGRVLHCLYGSVGGFAMYSVWDYIYVLFTLSFISCIYPSPFACFISWICWVMLCKPPTVLSHVIGLCG